MALSSILFVDAFDSFSQNIAAQLHHELRAQIHVIHIDTNIEQTFGEHIDSFVQKFSAIVLGPGPGHPCKPEDVGLFPKIIDLAATYQIPLLGICLGFQSLCLRYGLAIERMPAPCHGQVKTILPIDLDKSTKHEHPDLFKELSGKIIATCYNSLAIHVERNFARQALSRPGSSGTNASFQSSVSRDSASDVTCTYSDANSVLKVLAVDAANNVMIIVHKTLSLWGFQFHPESCKSNSQCTKLLKNWMSIVHKHNQARRPGHTVSHLQVLEQVPEPLNSTTVQQAPREDSILSARTEQAKATSLTKLDRSGLLRHLLEATSHTSDVVVWKTVPYHGPRQCLGDIFDSWSDGRGVSALESTRKGRFSMFALDECQPHLLPTTIPATGSSNSCWVEFSNSVAAIYSTRFGTNVVPATTCVTRAELMMILQDLMLARRATAGSPAIPFWGGLIGFMSYENGLDALGVESLPRSSRTVADLSMKWVERSVVYDAQTQNLYVQSLRKDDDDFVAAVAEYLSRVCVQNVQGGENEISAVSRDALQEALNSAQITMPDRASYQHNFEQCQLALHAGDSYELCLTTSASISLTTFTSRTTYSNFSLYKNLYAHNPVPFTAYLETPSLTICSTSPEQFMSWSRDGVIDMMPMKGTVRRSPDMTLEKATEILSTPKEQGENLMIADLIRHDLYSTVGYQNKVEVVKLCEVLEHETVYQLISHIRASAPLPWALSSLQQQNHVIRTGFRALEQSLPPGSMTGAPKKRSCQILKSLEDRNRGCYSGVLGYFDVGGGGCWSVLIRTAYRAKCEDQIIEKQTSNPDGSLSTEHVGTRHTWHIGAGGAITVLSSREGEWDEMQTKLNSVLKGFTKVK